eukprot:TRINITY_DN55622_c0_g1_i1.p1 TRINITY_DN55622_c0_g1~~TRINITY_DN55622_c0_g1_i1.p1  ORF type:complete len:667 (-),score=109.36 TRINITY_DN55622_c0_g1_i1:225-2225(-)
METDEVGYAPRKDFNPHAPVRLNTLHVFGVNFLSNKDVLSLFDSFEPKEIEWIDDSSCNVVFGDEETPSKVRMHLADASLEISQIVEPGEWTRTKDLTVGAVQAKQKAKTMAKAGQPRTVQLELRIATEADRKDYGHSGHTDSVYYASQKEKQAMQKQAMEMRRVKKRQRMTRLPSSDRMVATGLSCRNDPVGDPSAVADDPGTTTVVSTLVDADANATSPSAKEVEATSSRRLGCRGLLDPLLFLRVSTVGGDGSDTCAPGTSGQTLNEVEDLRSCLRKAEAEYAAVSLPVGVAQIAGSVGVKTMASSAASEPGSAATVGADDARRTGVQRGRQQVRVQRGSQDRGSSAQNHRGKKRRPVEQEPRAVSSVVSPVRRVEAFPAVEDFLKLHKVHCQRFHVLKSYRNIVFRAQSLSKAARLKAQSAPDATDGVIVGKNKSPAPVSHWDQYLKMNRHFTRHGQFMHTVAWKGDGRCILAVVAHPTRCDLDVMARALKIPKGNIKRMKLQEMQDGTKFPVFVCPPFGHPKDDQGRDPVLLVDSKVTEAKKPLLFDCGTVGLSISASEFLRSTGAACVEGLGYMPEAQSVSQATTPEPAPEPAPAAVLKTSSSDGNGGGVTSLTDTPQVVNIAPVSESSPVGVGGSLVLPTCGVEEDHGAVCQSDAVMGE